MSSPSSESSFDLNIDLIVLTMRLDLLYALLKTMHDDIKAVKKAMQGASAMETTQSDHEEQQSSSKSQ
ncbi:hypothetical protein Y032_0039g142 [Ancylostoma ceylanicum]|uniref:Uncharacterized protein n=1 Tax=Ancylostoma ceylanicum TaxID=53326 RepID=A0A016UJM2_9BILA|nr:hypothetical protein Y032_0039g142 [Ancylostoma ceylanicum]